jgi:hypothetical protein
MAIQIVEILGRSIQGVTRPFRCRCENGDIYYVKGHGATRHSLIAEFICGHLARSFGLPIADFEVVDVPQELIGWGGSTDMHDLGAGLAFGSKAIPHVQEFSVSHLPLVSEQLRKDIVIFDWWVHNADRTLSDRGGNPNLLWNQDACQLAVIDHNQAFDDAFNKQSFSELHVFRENLVSICDDLIDRVAYRDRLAAAFAEFELACDNVPPEWWWVDDGVPANFSRDAARAILERFNNDDFWRIAR